MIKKQRIGTLDYLRGLMALAIMFYHLISWKVNILNSNTFLGRLGIYGVSIFFILSGLSMAIVYNKFIDNIRTSIYFFVRRIFRIWPLLWVACMLQISILYFQNQSFSIKILILNMTTLFGFIKPGAYICTGAWSIGNEMVYYALTPLVIFLFNKKKLFGNLVFLFSVLVGMIFSLILLNNNKTLAEQWIIYINPFNNFFLYNSGIFIYYNLKDIKFNELANNVLLVVSILLFILIPIQGDPINIVTGFPRVIFVVLSLIIVICFWKSQTKLPKFISKPLETFGLVTYGVYILHPIVNTYISIILNRVGIKSISIQIFLIITITIISSLFIYYCFESKFINIGKRITNSSTIKFKEIDSKI